MTLPDLEKKADLLYSQALKKSKADHRGMVTCILCGKEMPWEESECSHYIPRGNKRTRFHPSNTHINCHDCNIRHNDNQEPFRKWMLANTFPGGVSFLRKLSREYISSLDYRILLDETIKQSKLILK